MKVLLLEGLLARLGRLRRVLPEVLYRWQPVLVLLPLGTVVARFTGSFSYVGVFVMPPVMFVGQVLFWFLTWSVGARTGRERLGRSQVPFAVYLAAATTLPLAVVADTSYTGGDVHDSPSVLMLMGLPPGVSRAVAWLCTVAIPLAGGVSLLTAYSAWRPPRPPTASPHRPEDGGSHALPGEAGRGTGGREDATRCRAEAPAPGEALLAPPEEAGSRPTAHTSSEQDGGPTAGTRWMRRLQQATPRTAWLSLLLLWLPLPGLDPLSREIYLVLVMPVLLAVVLAVALLVSLQVRRLGTVGPASAATVHLTVLLTVVLLLVLPGLVVVLGWVFPGVPELSVVRLASTVVAGALASVGLFTPFAVVAELLARR